MKKSIFYLLTLLFITASSCTVDVPETETATPKFSFKITGDDGFNHTFTQDDDFESFQLNLKKKTNYEFVFSGSDNDALKNLIWNFPGALEAQTILTLADDTLPGWYKTSRYDSSSDGVRFDGDSEDKVLSSSLEGIFYIYLGFDGDLNYNFDFTAKDYGDMNVDENVTHRKLYILVRNEDQPTEIVPRDPS